MCAKKDSEKKKGKTKKVKVQNIETFVIAGNELKYRLGTAFWRERRNQDKTQDEIAEKAGIKRQALGLIESGKRMSNISMLYSIASALEVPLWKLFKSAEEMGLDELRPALRNKIESEENT